jgi:small-conductance mechanosensitive channel
MSKLCLRAPALTLVVFLFAFLGDGSLFAQTPKAPAVAPVIAIAPATPTAREASLAGVLAARRQIEAELLAKQDLLRSERSRGREVQIEAQIQALSRELGELTRSFTELASGVDPLSIEPDVSQDDLELTREVRDLIGPLVNELKRATSRPREIDRLRTEISKLQERLAKITDALAQLDRFEDQTSDPEIVAALQAEKLDWKRRRSALRTALQVAELKLGQRLGESQSIAQAVENLFQLFFKSRGRNLLLALLATVTFLLTFRRLRTFISSRSAATRRSESFESRVFSLIYSAFSVIGAILVFLVALYFFGDWVLLIVMLMLILGVIWTSKQAIPRFWSQAVLILGMGAVREGERIILNGLPWKVVSISFYSTLENPDLVGGTLRLPIDDLADLRSREIREDEPWFPTQEGDVILLSDGRPAVVEFQSIENVRLRSPGNNRTIVPTSEFAGQSVEKLNGGYRVSIPFGLDYADQPAITTTMRETLERGVKEKWATSKWADSLVSASVEFSEAGASSLDYFVRVDLDGTQALDYQAQTRALSRYCVDVCNEQGWVIPFTQLTLHVANPS